ncbi:hypothetical protein SAMD00019534_102090 [Acytostelium subglobosum LB1]|uniref:hypothetical protein n=1 Tax=Acytostelium subglobosum LB1 TaxID=1410327 RepID=UPI000644BCF6|nr:hypothetical protein SAMD00019534_102090 [Acytostelium subglobosum LB1]GAM27034.1 hypothetical protein SAMD00019534_102090 [Acytostelium subglobosum LB1]|eukprot:XP_012749914.1 hypothetical protein SAMD00019534_102090 [Acytostelium subglobosum LB1]
MATATNQTANEEIMKLCNTVASIDGLEQFAKASERGASSLRDIKRYFKMRAQVEEEYSRKLAALAKFEPSVQSGCMSAAVMDVWTNIRQSASWEATYHETMYNNINESIVDSIDTLLSSIEKRNNTLMTDVHKNFHSYSDAVGKLRKSRQACERSIKEMMNDSATAATSGGAGQASGDTQKINRRVLKQSQDAIKINREHRELVSETNKVQANLYGKVIPHAIADLYRIEVYRSHMLKQYFSKFVNMVSLPTYQGELAQLRDKLQTINADSEVSAYVHRIKLSVNLDSNPRPFEVVDFNRAPGSNASSRDDHVSIPLILSQYHHHSSSSEDLKKDLMREIKEPKGDHKKKPSYLKRWSTSINFKAGGGSSGGSGNKQQQQAQAQFGVALDQLMASQKQSHPNLEIPLVLALIKRRMIKLDAFTTEGVFRVPSRLVDIDQLKKRLDDGSFDMEHVDNVHTISSLLKLWVREMPEPLIPFAMYDSFLGAADNHNELLVQFNKMPAINQRVLSYVLDIMRTCAIPDNVKHTMMNHDNLATVFSPSLIRSNSMELTNAMGNLSKEIAVVKLMLEYVPSISIDDDITAGRRESFSSNSSSSASGSSPLRPVLNNSLLPASSSPVPSSPLSIKAKISSSDNSVSPPSLSPRSPRSPPGSPVLPSPISMSSDLSTQSGDSEHFETMLLQECVKQLIEDFHSQMIQLYFDVTINEATSYCAMTISYTIVKLCRWLEDFVTTNLGIASYEDVQAEIERNNFSSPPAVNFKVPSSTPNLVPSELVARIPDLLRRWLLIFTAVVNHASHYLCYLGGMVIASGTSNELLQATQEFFGRNKLLSIADVLQSSHNNIDINASEKLIHGTIEMSTSYIPEHVLLQLQQLIQEQELMKQAEYEVENIITNLEEEVQIDSADEQISSLDVDVDVVGTSAATTPLVAMELSRENQELQVFVEEDEVIIVPEQHQLHHQHQQQQQQLVLQQQQHELIRQTAFVMIDQLKLKRDRLNAQQSWKEADKEQQTVLSAIAKQTQTVKLSLESLCATLELKLPKQEQPVLGENGQTAFARIAIFTKCFIDRSIVILRTILFALSSEIPNEFNNLLIERFTEMKQLMDGGRV